MWQIEWEIRAAGELQRFCIIATATQLGSQNKLESKGPPLVSKNTVVGGCRGSAWQCGIRDFGSEAQVSRHCQGFGQPTLRALQHPRPASLLLLGPCGLRLRLLFGVWPGFRRRFRRAPRRGVRSSFHLPRQGKV